MIDLKDTKTTTDDMETSPSMHVDDFIVDKTGSDEETSPMFCESTNAQDTPTDQDAPAAQHTSQTTDATESTESTDTAISTESTESTDASESTVETSSASEAQQVSESETSTTEKTEDAATSAPDAAAEMEQRLLASAPLDERIIEAVSEIYDPEIPVNIYELGLIYEINVKEDNAVEVIMTLTTPACPVAGSLPGEVEQKVLSVDGVESVHVELIWDPPWSPDMMSEAAQLQLGFFY